MKAEINLMKKGINNEKIDYSSFDNQTSSDDDELEYEQKDYYQNLSKHINAEEKEIIDPSLKEKESDEDDEIKGTTSDEDDLVREKSKDSTIINKKSKKTFKSDNGSEQNKIFEFLINFLTKMIIEISNEDLISDAKRRLRIEEKSKPKKLKQFKFLKKEKRAINSNRTDDENKINRRVCKTSELNLEFNDSVSQLILNLKENEIEFYNNDIDILLLLCLCFEIKKLDIFEKRGDWIMNTKIKLISLIDESVTNLMNKRVLIMECSKNCNLYVKESLNVLSPMMWLDRKGKIKEFENRERKKKDKLKIKDLGAVIEPSSEQLIRYQIFEEFLGSHSDFNVNKWNLLPQSVLSFEMMKLFNDENLPFLNIQENFFMTFLLESAKYNGFWVIVLHRIISEMIQDSLTKKTYNLKLFMKRIKEWKINLLVYNSSSEFNSDSTAICVIKSDVCEGFINTTGLLPDNDGQFSHRFIIKLRNLKHYYDSINMMISYGLLSYQYYDIYNCKDESVKITFFRQLYSFVTLFCLNDSKNMNELVQSTRYVYMLYLGDYGLYKGLGSKLCVPIRSTFEHCLKLRIRKMINKMSKNKSKLDLIKDSRIRDGELRGEFSSLIKSYIFKIDQKNTNCVMNDIYLCHMFNRDGDNMDKEISQVFNKSFEGYLKYENALDVHPRLVLGLDSDFFNDEGNLIDPEGFKNNVKNLVRFKNTSTSYSSILASLAGKKLNSYLSCKRMNWKTSLDINLGLSWMSNTTSIIKKSHKFFDYEKALYQKIKTKSIKKLKVITNFREDKATVKKQLDEELKKLGLSEELNKEINTYFSHTLGFKEDITSVLSKDDVSLEKILMKDTKAHCNLIVFLKKSFKENYQFYKEMNSKTLLKGKNKNQKRLNKIVKKLKDEENEFNLKNLKSSYMKNLKDLKNGNADQDSINEIAKLIDINIRRPNDDENMMKFKLNPCSELKDDLIESILSVKDIENYNRNDGKLAMENWLNFLTELYEPEKLKLINLLFKKYLRLISLHIILVERMNVFSSDQDTIWQTCEFISELLLLNVKNFDSNIVKLFNMIIISIDSDYSINDFINHLYSSDLDDLSFQIMNLRFKLKLKDSLTDVLNMMIKVKVRDKNSFNSNSNKAKKGRFSEALQKLNIRSKVIIELVGKFIKTPKSKGDLKCSIQDIAEDAIIKVKNDFYGIAKKNQFGGIRELGIQDFNTKLTNFVSEEFFKKINKSISSEIIWESLSHPSAKNESIEDAMKILKDYSVNCLKEDFRDDHLLIGCNVDHSKWGPNHAPGLNFRDCFKQMGDILGPNLDYIELKMIRSSLKDIEIPKSVLNLSLSKNWDYGLNALRDELRDDFILKGRCSVSKINDMIQGIYHHSSSTYACAVNLLMRDFIDYYCEVYLNCRITLMKTTTGSDDEFTIICIENKTKESELIKECDKKQTDREVLKRKDYKWLTIREKGSKLLSYIKIFKSLLNMKTSEKSTFSDSIFEFNSNFSFLGNNLIASIKHSILSYDQKCFDLIENTSSIFSIIQQAIYNGSPIVNCMLVWIFRYSSYSYNFKLLKIPKNIEIYDSMDMKKLINFYLSIKISNKGAIDLNEVKRQAFLADLINYNLEDEMKLVYDVANLDKIIKNFSDNNCLSCHIDKHKEFQFFSREIKNLLAYSFMIKDMSGSIKIIIYGEFNVGRNRQFENQLKSIYCLGGVCPFKMSNYLCRSLIHIEIENVLKLMKKNDKDHLWIMQFFSPIKDINMIVRTSNKGKIDSLFQVSYLKPINSNIKLMLKDCVKLKLDLKNLSVNQDCRDLLINKMISNIEPRNDEIDLERFIQIIQSEKLIFSLSDTDSFKWKCFSVHLCLSSFYKSDCLDENSKDTLDITREIQDTDKTSSKDIERYTVSDGSLYSAELLPHETIQNLFEDKNIKMEASLDKDQDLSSRRKKTVTFRELLFCAINIKPNLEAEIKRKSKYDSLIELNSNLSNMRDDLFSMINSIEASDKIKISLENKFDFGRLKFKSNSGSEYEFKNMPFVILSKCFSLTEVLEMTPNKMVNIEFLNSDVDLLNVLGGSWISKIKNIISPEEKKKLDRKTDLLDNLNALLNIIEGNSSRSLQIYSPGLRCLDVDLSKKTMKKVSKSLIKRNCIYGLNLKIEPITFKPFTEDAKDESSLNLSDLKDLITLSYYYIDTKEINNFFSIVSNHRSAQNNFRSLLDEIRLMKKNLSVNINKYKELLIIESLIKQDCDFNELNRLLSGDILCYDTNSISNLTIHTITKNSRIMQIFNIVGSGSIIVINEDDETFINDCLNQFSRKLNFHSESFKWQYSLDLEKSLDDSLLKLLKRHLIINHLLENLPNYEMVTYFINKSRNLVSKDMNNPQGVLYIYINNRLLSPSTSLGRSFDNIYIPVVDEEGLSLNYLNCSAESEIRNRTTVLHNIEVLMSNLEESNNISLSCCKEMIADLLKSSNTEGSKLSMRRLSLVPWSKTFGWKSIKLFSNSLNLYNFILAKINEDESIMNTANQDPSNLRVNYRILQSRCVDFNTNTESLKRRDDGDYETKLIMDNVSINESKSETGNIYDRIISKIDNMSDSQSSIKSGIKGDKKIKFDNKITKELMDALKKSEDLPIDVRMNLLNATNVILNINLPKLDRSFIKKLMVELYSKNYNISYFQNYEELDLSDISIDWKIFFSRCLEEGTNESDRLSLTQSIMFLNFRSFPKIIWQVVSKLFYNFFLQKEVSFFSSFMKNYDNYSKEIIDTAAQFTKEFITGAITKNMNFSDLEQDRLIYIIENDFVALMVTDEIKAELDFLGFKLSLEDFDSDDECSEISSSNDSNESYFDPDEESIGDNDDASAFDVMTSDVKKIDLNEWTTETIQKSQDSVYNDPMLILKLIKKADMKSIYYKFILEKDGIDLKILILLYIIKKFQDQIIDSDELLKRLIIKLMIDFIVLFKGITPLNYFRSNDCVSSKGTRFEMIEITDIVTEDITNERFHDLTFISDSSLIKTIMEMDSLDKFSEVYIKELKSDFTIYIEKRFYVLRKCSNKSELESWLSELEISLDFFNDSKLKDLDELYFPKRNIEKKSSKKDRFKKVSKNVHSKSSSSSQLRGKSKSNASSVYQSARTSVYSSRAESPHNEYANKKTESILYHEFCSKYASNGAVSEIDFFKICFILINYLSEDFYLSIEDFIKLDINLDILIKIVESLEGKISIKLKDIYLFL